MKYKLLGNSGLRVSEFALGTMTFGNEWGWGAAKDESEKLYNAFRDSGGNFVDTANSYTYSLLERTVERELIPMAKALNLGVTAWSPLSKGVLTGKYHGHGSSESARMSGDMMKPFLPEELSATRVVAAVKSVADQVGRSMAQVALSWLRTRPVPVIPIIGARKLSQLQDNLASSELLLSPKQIKALDEASRVALGFPYDFYAKEMVRAFIYGGMRDQIA